MEEDRLEFEHAGLKCLIFRMPIMGHLCGYVGITQEHPWYGKQYSQCLKGCKGKASKYFKRHDIRTYDCTWGEDSHPSPECLISVHGGLTFSGEGGGEIWLSGYWWFGFDAAHYGDMVPKICSKDGIYRDMEYMRHETERLAEQLAAITLGDNDGS